MLDAGGIAEQQRALAEIIQHQRRKNQPEPGSAQCGAAKMPHIGIKRLRAGHREKDRAQHEEAGPGSIDEQREPVDAG